MTKLILLAGAALLVGTTPAMPIRAAKAVRAVIRRTFRRVRRLRSSTIRLRTSGIRLPRGRALIVTAMASPIGMKPRLGGMVAHCAPPGLAKKTPACIPPGQAKRIFREGQRLPSGYRYYTDYSNLPLILRDRYELNDDYRYIYRNNTI